MRALLAIGLTMVLVVVSLEAAGRPGPEGREPKCDLLTAELTFPNIGSKLDGAGMCVTTSVEYLLLYAGMEEWRGFRDWCAVNYTGGAGPSKLDKMLQAYAKAKGLEDPRRFILQVQGDTLPVIEMALKTRRPVGLTDCGNPKLYGQPVPHFTTCVGIDPAQACMLDNNRPRDEDWIDRQEFRRRHSWGGMTWVVVVLKQPPPPIPSNQAAGRGRVMFPLLLGSLLALQAGPAGCCPQPVPVGFQQMPTPGTTYKWQWNERDRQHELFRCGPQGCVWCGAYRDRQFWVKDAQGQWIKGTLPCDPPEGREGESVEPPDAPKRPPQADVPAALLANPGLDRSQLDHVPAGRAELRLGGRKWTARPGEVASLLADGGQLEDDSGKLHVVIGGDPQRTSALLAELQRHPEWARLQPYLMVHVRDPKHWHLAHVGYGGAQQEPGVTITGPAHATSDKAKEYGFVPLATATADQVVEATAGAVRTVDPNYRRSAPPSGGASPMSMWVIFLAAVVLLVIVAAFALVAWALSAGPQPTAGLGR